MGGNLPEGALGLVIPEAMKLSDALIEKLLSLGPGTLDGEGNLSGSRDRKGGMPGTLVEGLTLMGVARLGLVFPVTLWFLLSEGEREGPEQGCQQREAREAMQAHARNTNTTGGVLPTHLAGVSGQGYPEGAFPGNEGKPSAGRKSGWLPRLS